MQTEQHDKIDSIIKEPVTYYPVIRARIGTANGVEPKDIDAPEGEDDPTRVFNLSYADTIMDTEFITESLTDDALYTPIENQDPSVSTLEQVQPLSILDTAAEMLNVGMGDQISFNIQGIELTGRNYQYSLAFRAWPESVFLLLV